MKEQEDMWEKFTRSGKISDYLEYRCAVNEKSRRDGEENGDPNSQWDRTEGISGW